MIGKKPCLLEVVYIEAKFSLEYTDKEGRKYERKDSWQEADADLSRHDA